MKKHPLNIFSVFVVALLCFQTTLAQDAGSSKRSNFRSALLSPDQIGFPDIHFDEYRISEVVAFLRDYKETSSLNFIISKEVDEIPVTLQLRNVSFAQLIKAIEIATDGRVTIEAVDGEDDPPTLFHVRPGSQPVPVSDPVLKVFNLSKFLAGKKDAEADKALEDLHQTVEIAFEMLANAQRAAGKYSQSRHKINSKFHPGTKLMIVIGDPADVEVFREVTSQLIGTSRQNKSVSSFGGMEDGGMGAMGGDFGFFGGDDGMDAGGGMSVPKKPKHPIRRGGGGTNR